MVIPLHEVSIAFDMRTDNKRIMKICLLTSLEWLILMLVDQSKLINRQYSIVLIFLQRQVQGTWLLLRKILVLTVLMKIFLSQSSELSVWTNQIRSRSHFPSTIYMRHCVCTEIKYTYNILVRTSTYKNT